MSDTCEFTHSVKAVAACLRLWGLELAGLREDLDVAGSPERCRQRVVLEEEKGGLFLLEEIDVHQKAHRHSIARCLQQLDSNGVPCLNLYLEKERRGPVLHHRGCFWQLSPYIEGVVLDRPAYVMDSWRGPLLADFLIHLQHTAERNPAALPANTFSIARYIRTLTGQIAAHDAHVLPPLKPVLDFLGQDFMTLHDRLPTAFCHGDYHCLNIIWGRDHIKTVIDWEFCGSRPELYDAANMIGCVGIEDPNALTGELVLNFTGFLRRKGTHAKMSWQYLPELVVALRFGWLAEWLRNRDEEMIRLELDYMRLLVDGSRVFPRC